MNSYHFSLEVQLRMLNVRVLCRRKVLCRWNLDEESRESSHIYYWWHITYELLSSQYIRVLSKFLVEGQPSLLSEGAQWASRSSGRNSKQEPYSSAHPSCRNWYMSMSAATPTTLSVKSFQLELQMRHTA